MNLPALMTHRMIQNINYKTNNLPSDIATEIRFYRYSTHTEINIFNNNNHILTMIQGIAQRLTKTKLENKYKITIYVPKTFSPTTVMIQLPYLPVSHRFNDYPILPSHEIQRLMEFSFL